MSDFIPRLYISVKTVSISHNRAVLGGKNLSDLHILSYEYQWASHSKLEVGGQYLMSKLDSNIPLKVHALVKTALIYYLAYSENENIVNTYLSIFRQTFPSRSILGWYTMVSHFTFGGSWGYPCKTLKLNTKRPPL